MKTLTAEWVEKAEGDFATLLREMRARKSPNHDAACFHAQQCAEKYLKARLCEAGIGFERIHDLVALLDQALAVEPGWVVLRADMAWLTAFAVTYRYPGESADKPAVQSAATRCRRFRLAARESLGLPGK